MPTDGASGGQVSRRRGSGRATVRAMDERPTDEPAKGELDLLTIGLLVFFVALIGTVVALLLLQAVV
jgi:hypothetical protein